MGSSASHVTVCISSLEDTKNCKILQTADNYQVRVLGEACHTLWLDANAVNCDVGKVCYHVLA